MFATAKARPMTEEKATADNQDAAPALPDHLSLDPRSPHFDGDVL